MFEEKTKILTGKDTVRGCRYFEELSKESSKSDKYYEMTDELYSLLESANAYVRIRSFSLMCFQARWDRDNKLDKYIWTNYLRFYKNQKNHIVRKIDKFNFLFLLIHVIILILSFVR